MKASWKILSARNLLAAGLALATPGISVYRATQYARAEPRQRTTTAYNVRINYRASQSLIGFLINNGSYSCDYSFGVDGASYSSHIGCRQLIDDSIKSEFNGYSGSIRIPDRVVYYDSADPSMNDLMEFSAVSESYYSDAAVFIGLGVVVGLLVASAAAIPVNRKRPNRNIFVDTHGTVIHPDEIDYNLGSDGLFNKDRRTEASNAAGDGAPAYVADSDPSHARRELYLEVVNQIHPDRATDERDEALRERLMKEANAAFKRGDSEALRRILIEYRTVLANR
ncbi:MAG: hypothetical protein WBQ94_21855 [Terracidiphilus sp.]